MQLSDIAQRDWARYSVRRILAERQGIHDGLEAEISREIQRDFPEQLGNIAIPFAALGQGQRDLTVGTFGAGGATVQTDVRPTVIEILRNATVCGRLGAQTLNDLRGPVALPRQVSTGTAQSLGETAPTTTSNPTFDQPNLTPHRIGFSCQYSRQLLLQSSVDVENFIRQDMLKTVAQKVDQLCLEGDGSNSQPTGVKNTSGIASVAFIGAPTWEKIIAFETAVASANGMLGPAAYITSPTVRGKLKATPKVSSSAFPIFVWEDGNFNDKTDDGKVNCYRAAASNQITQSQLAFGIWSDLILGVWGSGVDVLVDPFSLAAEGKVRITGTLFFDAMIQHPQCFAWSADAATLSD